ncbi:hypothetical protein B0H11DRAFT_2032149 [Mycena galericulata]|nr:hypothetical protein B0H11DRAFT_2032149 [Mycena galericulata]
MGSLVGESPSFDELPPAELRSRKTHIQSEIRRYKSYIADLEAQERWLDTQLDLIVYPVLTLPSEITSQIFVHCLPAHGRVRPSPRRAPLLLAQICTLWREIAHSTGQLWGSVDLKFEFGYYIGAGWADGGEYGDLPNPDAFPLLRTWLSRTKGCPVSLTLRSRHRQLSPDLLSLIPLYSKQLHRLELTLAPTDMEHLRRASAAFPRLRHLAISCHDDSRSIEGLVSTFGPSSALRQLRVLSHQSSIAASRTYPFLTTLDLQDTSETTVMEMLAQCPQLLHLSAHLRDPETLSVALAPVTLGLHSLILAAYNGYGAAPPMLNYLTLPDLRRLDLRHDSQFDVLASFLARSGCIPDHLGTWINSKSEAQGELNNLLRRLPSLSSLAIYTGPHIHTVVYILGVLPSLVGALPDVVPKLKALTLTTWEHNYDYKHLLGFLERRRMQHLHPVPLESFHLELCENQFDQATPRPMPSIFRAFEKLMAEGLDIQVSTRHSRWPEERMYMDSCEFYPEWTEYLAPQV